MTTENKLDELKAKAADALIKEAANTTVLIQFLSMLLLIVLIH